MTIETKVTVESAQAQGLTLDEFCAAHAGLTLEQYQEKKQAEIAAVKDLNKIETLQAQLATLTPRGEINSDAVTTEIATDNSATNETGITKFEEGKTYFTTWEEETGRPHMRRYTIKKRTAKTVVINGSRSKIHYCDWANCEMAKVGYGSYILAKDLFTEDAIKAQAESDAAWDEIEVDASCRMAELKAAKAEREEILSTPLVNVEAQEVATDAEIELASHTEQAPAIVETEKFAEIIFEASALGYTGNSISKDFNNPISAYRWLKRLAKRSRNYNDGSMHITRWNTDGSRSTVYDNAGSHLEINDNSLKDFIDAQDAKEHIDSVYRSLCNGAIFYQNHFGLTQEQAEKILVAIHANNISNKEVDQMIEAFKTEQTAAQDSVEVETNNSEADDEREIKIEDDILTFINGRLDNIYSAKYGAMIQFLPDGGRKYFTCPLSLDGKTFDKDFDRWDIEDFFAILSERGAIATDIQPDTPKYPRCEEFADDINRKSPLDYSSQNDYSSQSQTRPLEKVLRRVRP